MTGLQVVAALLAGLVVVVVLSWPRRRVKRIALSVRSWGVAVVDFDELEQLLARASAAPVRQGGRVTSQVGAGGAGDRGAGFGDGPTRIGEMRDDEPTRIRPANG